MSESPARHLNLAGASNFRDLGGYPGKDGRPVRWRQIFRSNHLGHLTASDIEVLRSLGVKSAFDFRGIEERAMAICGLSEIAVHSLPIEPTVVAALRARGANGVALSSADALEVMRTNRFYRRDPSASSDLPDDVRQVLGSVEASFLAAAFDTISADYGSLECYFTDVLGVGTRERARLEARYLEC
jgi:protein tyrosine/serine phosphatase